VITDKEYCGTLIDEMLLGALDNIGSIRVEECCEVRVGLSTN